MQKNAVSCHLSNIIAVASIVTDIQVNSPNETTLVISWEPPANPNGNVNGYAVSIVNMGENSIVTQGTVSMQRFSETGLGNADRKK